MTTTPQNSPRNNNRHRKRQSSGSTIPIIPMSGASPSSMSSGDMAFLGDLQVAAANSQAATAGGPAGNMYGNDPALSLPPTSQAESYRHQTSSQGGVNLYPTATDNQQLARVNRGGNQLMRVPSFGGATPASPMSMGMEMMNGASLMAQQGAFSQQVDGIDGGIDHQELYSKIDKMKKKRASIPPFVLKLSSFVNDPKTDHLIRWSPSGNSFMVLDEDEFSKTLIPDLFKHNNYASFVRQLNMYGFHKVVGLADGSLKTSEQRSKPPSEYENMYFKRGQPDLMWLIQKPKSKKANGGRGKRTKQDEQDTDKEDGLSDAGGGDNNDNTGGGYLEGPRDGNRQNENINRSNRLDMQALVGQLEAVRNHQAMISAAINRLRKDHQQLYEQSLAFQSLHDRHENSINAILTFLATVYDKSLGGHINGAVNNLFAHQVEQGQGVRHGAQGTTANGSTNGAIISSSPAVRPGVHQAIRTPQLHRRRPLLIEGGPSNTSEDLDGQQQQQSTFQTPYQQTANIQEFFNKPTPHPASPSGSPRQQNGNDPQTAGLYSPSAFSLPSSPQNAGTPPSIPRLPPASAIPSASPVHVPRSLARTLGTPLTGSSQALIDHNASLAQKTREIQDLEVLQAAQNQHIDHLMGMVRGYTQSPDASTPQACGGNAGGNHDDVTQYFDFGAGENGFEGDQVDLDELLRGVGVDVDVNCIDVGEGGQVLGTNPSTVAPSPGNSSPGSSTRAREEVEEVGEEVQAKRRKVA